METKLSKILNKLADNDADLSSKINSVENNAKDLILSSEYSINSKIESCNDNLYELSCKFINSDNNIFSLLLKCENLEEEIKSYEIPENLKNYIKFTSKGKTSIQLSAFHGLNENLYYITSANIWKPYDGSFIELNDGEWVGFENKLNVDENIDSPLFKFTMTGEIAGRILGSGNTQSLMNYSNNLTPYCYFEMFKDCGPLETAPELPVLTLKEHCYEQMFMNCKNLTSSPDLPAINVKEACYKKMFYGCEKLNRVRTNQTSFSGNCYKWLWDVSRTGEFICSKLLTIYRGVSECPSDWIVTTIKNNENSSSESSIPGL